MYCLGIILLSLADSLQLSIKVQKDCQGSAFAFLTLFCFELLHEIFSLLPDFGCITLIEGFSQLSF